MIFPTMSLADYIVISGMGTADGVGFTVASNTVVTQKDNPILAHTADASVLIDEIQFDGVISGQVVYEFNTEGNSFPAYAVPSVPVEMNVLSVGRGPSYEIQNTSAQPCVVNIKFVSISADHTRLIQTAFAQFGGTFGLDPRKVH